MIIELTENNLEEAKNSFLSIDEVKQEFKNNPFARYLILKEKDELLGYLYYSDIYERAEINQFEIKKSHRNCGKGQKLLNFFLKHVEKDITLEVNKENLPAIHLYEKVGFVKQAIRNGYYDGVDGILMERKKDNKEF